MTVWPNFFSYCYPRGFEVLYEAFTLFSPYAALAVHMLSIASFLSQ